MIEAHQLSKQFGAFQAVSDLDLEVRSGELLALLGPNGAGKTTTVRMLGAILRPSGGYARIAGLDVVEQAQAVRGRVGLLTEYPGLYGRMTALEYLDFFGALQGLDGVTRRRRIERLLRQFGLWDVRERRLESYSKGMRQKIALVRALIHDPPVLFLDEPTTAMDPQSARTVRDAIGALRNADRAILLTTHNLAEAEALADRIAIIRGGRIIAQGTFAELSRQLLGAPTFELRLAPGWPARTVMPFLEDLAPVDEVGDDWIRFRCDEPQHVNPRLLARLAEQSVPVVALAEVPRSLEEVYLRIVADDQGRPVASPSLSEAEVETALPGVAHLER